MKRIVLLLLGLLLALPQFAQERKYSTFHEPPDYGHWTHPDTK
jgi:hypothetical protein